MASEHFWYNPTTGNGSTEVSISADTMNSTHADKLSTITFTAGSASKTVSVRQKYMPYKQQFASTTFPATGGDIYFTVHSEYDVVFRSVPDWITISREGTVYSEGQRISSGVVDNKTFTLTAAANTGEARSISNTFNMGHYIGDTLQNIYSYFNFSQEGAIIERKWYINNNTGLHLYGTITTTSTDISIEMQAGEEEERTESTPVYITGFAIVANPMPSSPENKVILLSNTETGNSLGGVFNGSAWVVSGNLTVNEGDTLSLDLA